MVEMLNFSILIHTFSKISTNYKPYPQNEKKIQEKINKEFHKLQAFAL